MRQEYSPFLYNAVHALQIAIKLTEAQSILNSRVKKKCTEENVSLNGSLGSTVRSIGNLAGSARFLTLPITGWL